MRDIVRRAAHAETTAGLVQHRPAELIQLELDLVDWPPTPITTVGSTPA
jgi:hypothetical protein